MKDLALELFFTVVLGGLGVKLKVFSMGNSG